MGKTRDLFKKIRDTKGTFHVKMGSVKDRNGRDLTEAENIKIVCSQTICLIIHSRTFLRVNIKITGLKFLSFTFPLL